MRARIFGEHHGFGAIQDMTSSDFVGARFGLFAAAIGLVGVGYYAYTLRAEVQSQEQAVAKYVSENAALQANLVTMRKENGANAEALVVCNKAVADAEAKLAEISKSKSTTRKK